MATCSLTLPERPSLCPLARSPRPASTTAPARGLQETGSHTQHMGTRRDETGGRGLDQKQWTFIPRFVQECKDAFENGRDRPPWPEGWRPQPLPRSMASFTILLGGDKLADSPTVTPTTLAIHLIQRKGSNYIFPLDSSEDFVQKKTHTSTIENCMNICKCLVQSNYVKATFYESLC